MAARTELIFSKHFALPLYYRVSSRQSIDARNPQFQYCSSCDASGECSREEDEKKTLSSKVENVKGLRFTRRSCSPVHRAQDGCCKTPLRFPI